MGAPISRSILSPAGCSTINIIQPHSRVSSTGLTAQAPSRLGEHGQDYAAVTRQEEKGDHCVVSFRYCFNISLFCSEAGAGVKPARHVTW
jgi:hypothetical protein